VLGMGGMSAFGDGASFRLRPNSDIATGRRGGEARLKKAMLQVESPTTPPSAPSLRIFIFTALGCSFWLFLFVGAITRVTRFGFYLGWLPLFVIPVAMLALTIVLGLFLRPGKYLSPVMGASSVAACLSVVFWLSIWGESV
jgi:hypothetical protein